MAPKPLDARHRPGEAGPVLECPVAVTPNSAPRLTFSKTAC